MGDVHCVDSLPIFKKVDEDLKSFTKFIDAELDVFRLEEQKSEDQQQSIMDTSEASTSTTRRPRSPDLFPDMIDDDTLTQLTAIAEEKYMATPPNKIVRTSSPPGAPLKPRGIPIDRSQLKPRELFKPSYKLSSIYERYFGTQPPVAHRAEEDALILLKCSRFHAKDFLSHIPSHARELQSYCNSYKV